MLRGVRRGEFLLVRRGLRLPFSRVGKDGLRRIGDSLGEEGEEYIGFLGTDKAIESVVKFWGGWLF